MSSNEKIDFVMIWVDGNDENWQNEKMKFAPIDNNGDSRNVRYRDWDNLQYWFRGVEKFAPWVNKIHFVTCGHLPKWLNIDNPKLNIVKHSDYIPKEYLPTFSSHPIELNLHRIEGLADKFVYFNDDCFITNKIKETDFFCGDKPKAMAVFNPVTARDEIYSSVLDSNIRIINRHFTKKEICHKYLSKYLNIKYGLNNIRTLLCLPWDKILGFKETHHCNAYLKTTFSTVWSKEYQVLDETCRHKFRTYSDVNQCVFKYWQFCEGNFIPQKNIRGYYPITDNVKNICQLIEKQKYKLLCLNDSDSLINFEDAKMEIIKSFEKILPEKSSFEK